MVMDAASIMGAADDAAVAGINDLAVGEYKRNVQESMPRDYVRMYHPDNTTSIVQLPPIGKNGKGIKDRQQKIMHYVLNKRKAGKQWWYASPPAGWEPKVARYACFLQGCDRNREPNLHTLFDLFQHFNHKHPDETKMYEGVLKAIQQKLSTEIPPELAEQLGLDSSTRSLDEGQFAQVMTGQNLVPAEQMVEMLAPDASVELEADEAPTGFLTCAVDGCGYTTEGKTEHEFALTMHSKHKHAEGG